MKTLREIGGRLKQLRKTHYYSQQSLAKELGLSQGMLSCIENKKSSISLGTLIKVSEIFNVSIEWLIHGEGAKATEERRQDFIPLVSQKATAGYIGKLEEPDKLEERGFYKIPGFTEGHFRLFEITGDQMHPSLEKNDLAICEKIFDQNNIPGGAICVVVCPDRLWVQRVYPDQSSPDRYIFSSDNENYKSRSVKKTDIVEAWRIKSKITNSFVNHSLERIKRVKNLEIEVATLKVQYRELFSKI